MYRSIRRLATGRFTRAAALGCLLSVACSPPQRQDGPSASGSGETSEGRSLPAVKVKDLQGRELDVASLKGRVLVINFWATWCAPCRVESPDLSALYQKYKGQGLEVLGMVVESGSANDVAPFVKEFGIAYPVYVGDEVREQLYSGPGLPGTLIVNRRGQIVQTLIGLRTLDAFEKAVVPLLAEGA